MAKLTPFVTHIVEGMSNFGITLNDYFVLSDKIQKLIMTDNTHNTGYVALAREESSKNPEDFWQSVLKNQFKKLLTETAQGSETLPAALIVPSSEADAAYEESIKLGTAPSIYQLFEGYVILAFKKQDTALLAEPLKTSQQKEEVKEEQSAHKEYDDKDEQPYIVNKKHEVKDEEAQKNNVHQKAATKIDSKELPPASKKKGLSSGKIVTAALLGVALGSIPFAINKYKEKEVYPEEAPAVVEVLESSIQGTEGDENVLAALAANAPLSSFELEKLINEGFVKDVLKNPYLPREKMKEFANSSDPFIRMELAKNEALPLEIALQLAEDRSSIVRASIAENPVLPMYELERLSNDSDYVVRASVLGNPKLNVKLLDAIEPYPSNASCENKEKIFASNCYSANTLNYNATNPDICIRKGIARNKSAYKETLALLVKDNNPAVKRNALSNPSLSREELDRANQELFSGDWYNDTSIQRNAERRALLLNPMQDDAILSNYKYNPAVFAEIVAKNPKISKEHAKILLHYARPKGGVVGFINDVNKIPSDKKVIVELFLINDEEGDWKKELRKKVNKSFRHNIYDPVSMAEQALNKDKILKDDVTSADTNNNKKSYIPKSLELGQSKGEKEFFEDHPNDLKLAEGNYDRFEEFFESFDKSDAKAKKVLHVADAIIDGVIEEITPIVEGTIEKMEKEIKSLVEKHPSDNSSTAPKAIKSFANKETLINVLSQDGVMATPLYIVNNESSFLSHELYDKSCRDINSLFVR